MERKTLLILLTVVLMASLVLTVGPVSASYKSTEGEYWEPISANLLDFGRMTFGVSTISWENINRDRAIEYKVIMTKRNEWLIEFAKEPFPRFGNIVCRTIRFRLKYSRLFAYQISLEAQFYSAEQNPFVNAENFSLQGSYSISVE